MIRREAVILVIILALLAGLTWYTNQPDNLISKQMEADATATSVPVSFLVGFEYGTISEMEINDSQGRSIHLYNTQGVWMVSSGGTENVADQASASAAATQAQTLRILTTLEMVSSLDTLGLENPAITFRMKFGDLAEKTFRIGNATVTNSGYYVLTDEGKVVIVDTFSIDALTGMLDTPPIMEIPAPAP